MTKRKMVCNTCGRPLNVYMVAASTSDGSDTKYWCVPCWDSPDEIAVSEYRNTTYTEKSLCDQTLTSKQ